MTRTWIAECQKIFESSMIMIGAVAAILAIGVPTLTSAQGAQRPITFSRDVAPLVFDHCVSCHRPGESAPFSLLTYREVKPRAGLIAEVTASHYMPPWQPDAQAGTFTGDRRLDNRQIAIVRQWVEDGALEGDPSDLPPVPTMVPGWRLGTPDLTSPCPQPSTCRPMGATCSGTSCCPCR